MIINYQGKEAKLPDFLIVGAAFAGMTSLMFWNIYTLFYIKIKYGRTIGYLPLASMAVKEVK